MSFEKWFMVSADDLAELANSQPNDKAGLQMMRGAYQAGYAEGCKDQQEKDALLVEDAPPAKRSMLLSTLAAAIRKRE